MDVSGMPVFLGGVGGGCSVCGWYALAVCRWRVCLADDMERKHWGQLLDAEREVEVAKRNMDGAAANALVAERGKGMAKDNGQARRVVVMERMVESWACGGFDDVCNP